MAEINGAVGETLSDSRRAMHNALKLTSALAVTWAIGLAVRVVLPRHLGPELFGEFNFADALAATLCVGLNLGLDTHIRKDAAVRPEQVSGFYGGVLALRTALLAVILVAIALVLHLTHRPPSLIGVALLFSTAQYFVTANTTLAAILHASGQVDELSFVNVGSKLMWGAIIAVGVLMGPALLPFVLALLLSEAAKTVALWIVARRKVGLRMRFELAGTREALVASLPFFVGGAAQAAYSRLDVTILSFLAPAVEVGYYGAAQSIAGIGMLAAPIVGWVLTPALSRAAARSAADFERMMRRSLEAVLGAIVPAVLILAVGADVWTRLILGAAFAPAAPALAIVAGALLFTYFGTLASVFLVAEGRGWHMTAVMGAGLIANLAGNLLLIKPMMLWLDRPGAGGIGCAIAQLLSESVTAAAVLLALGRRAWDGRAVLSLAKALGICALVVAADHWLRRFGPVRLAADAAIYLALGLLLGVIRPAEMIALVRGRPAATGA